MGLEPEPAVDVGAIALDGRAGFGHAIRRLAHALEDGEVMRANRMPIVVPEPRFELGRPCGPRSLSPLRLPFRHSGAAQA